MANIHLQQGRAAAALPYIQEAVTMFRETGSRHLPEAEKTLQTILENIAQGDHGHA